MIAKKVKKIKTFDSNVAIFASFFDDDDGDNNINF